MSTSISGSVRTIINSSFVNALDLASATDALQQTFNDAFTNGTGADKAQVQWHDQRSLASGATESLDLAGSLTSAFGVVTFTKVKWLIIRVVTETTGYKLGVGGAAANQFINWVADSSDIVYIGAGGMLVLSSPVDGFAVTAGTGDILKIANAAGGDTITYDIIVIGEGSVA